MHSQPLISVCIPSYNNEDFVGATLESVLRQTCADFEIVITDDHSSDSTVSVISSFTDPRIRLVRNETNLGMGANWNKALSLAQGEYVKVLCGDDVLYPDCLRQQVSILNHPGRSSIALAVCGTDVINIRGQIVLRRRLGVGPGQINGRSLIRNCVRRGYNLIGEPLVGLFRKDILTRPGMFDPGNPYMIDLLFWSELLKTGDAHVDERRLAAFRISRSALSTTIGLKQAAYFRRFIRKIHKDRAFPTSTLDVLTGYYFSLQWCILRNLFIRFRAGKADSQV